jgi:hypothetical protein
MSDSHRSVNRTIEEISSLCAALPPEKRLEVADFAHFLLLEENDEAWERLIADPRERPRLEAFLDQTRSEGDESLDPSRL